MKACAADGASDPRIITPAFVHGFTFWIVVTRATMVPSPSRVRYAKWSASAVPQTSAPAPVTLKVPPVALAVPAAPVAPTSLSLQPSGSALAGGVAGLTVIVTALDVVVA